MLSGVQYFCHSIADYSSVQSFFVPLSKYSFVVETHDYKNLHTQKEVNTDVRIVHMDMFIVTPNWEHMLISCIGGQL